MSDLSILIVTYNSESAIGSCLDNIPAGFRSGVIVVDNASTDRTVEIVESRNVLLIRMQTNTGLATAANAAAKAASAPFVCFLNPDCIAPPEFFDTALKQAQQNPLDCIVPEILEEPGNLVRGRQSGYTGWKLIDDMLASNYGENAVTRRLKSLVAYHDEGWYWPHGACFVVGREHFLSLGGFDSRYFLYMVDVEFGRRLSASGSRVVPVNSRVIHHRSSSSNISNRLHLSLLNHGRVRYAQIHHGPFLSRFLQLLGWPAQAARSVFTRTS